jgi:hypothetical protein
MVILLTVVVVSLPLLLKFLDKGAVDEIGHTNLYRVNTVTIIILNEYGNALIQNLKALTFRHAHCVSLFLSSKPQDAKAFCGLI